jgi:hypothetical protein
MFEQETLQPLRRKRFLTAKGKKKHVGRNPRKYGTNGTSETVVYSVGRDGKRRACLSPSFDQLRTMT